MKTGKEWLAKLQEPYRSQVEENINKQHRLLNTKYSRLSKFIMYSFTWEHTEQ